MFSVWLSGLIKAQPIGLAAASPQSVQQSQAAGYGVFPLDRRSCAAWFIPSIGPKEPWGWKGLQRLAGVRGSRTLALHCISLLKSWDIRYIEEMCFPLDLQTQGPCAPHPIQPVLSPLSEGTMACTHCQLYPELSIGLVPMGTSLGKRANRLAIIKAEATRL